VSDLLLGRTLVLVAVFATVIGLGWFTWLRERR
jgi:hypothetical protein